MIGAFVDLGVTNFDLSVLTVVADGHAGEEKVRGHQLCKADVREVRSRMVDILTEADQSHWSVVLRPRQIPGLLLVQLDDLRRDVIATIAGFSFLILETSPQNFQVWLAIRATLKQKDLSAFFRGLRRTVGADPCASGASRIAGSTNFKPKYAPNFPQVRIESLHTNNIVSCEDLEAAGMVALEAPRFIPSARAVPQGKRGYPDYNLALRGAPLRADGSGKDRSKADAFWCKWAAERGYHLDEIASELLRISAKAREEIARGNANYAIEKARWGVKVADKRCRQEIGSNRVDAADSGAASPAAAKVVPTPLLDLVTVDANLPPDLAALVDEELGITADLFVAPKPPLELKNSLPPAPDSKPQAAHPEVATTLFAEQLEAAKADKYSNPSKGKPCDVNYYPD
jgi:hypothetical protein